jgi:hypothetical protein
LISHFGKSAAKIRRFFDTAKGFAQKVLQSGLNQAAIRPESGANPARIAG